MNKFMLSLGLAATLCFTPLAAQEALTLDSCVALALKGNKAMRIAEAKGEKAAFEQKAARTNYLPKINATAAYMRTGDEISLLNDKQKQTLSSLGTNIGSSVGTQLGQTIQQIVAANPSLAPLVQQIAGQMPGLAAAGNALGSNIVDAFRTDTRNTTVGAILLTQPLYMGGKIRAYDRITQQAVTLADEQKRAAEHEVRLDVETAYWQVVALANKQRLATNYRDLLLRLNDDVEKMIKEGVATKANGLTVAVKLNEAEMTLTKVENGLTLSRLLLAQLCDLPMDGSVRLADESVDDLGAIPSSTPAVSTTDATQQALTQRPEMRQLAAAEQMYLEKVNIQRSEFLPQLALTGGYGISNPSVFNGFENKFKGTWAVGVMLKVPVWHWGEGRYKVSAAKAEARVSTLQREEVGEKIELQVRQQAFRMTEAEKKLTLALKNLDKAEENLRTAQVGHKEGVIVTSDLLAAQTAWLQAHSEKIDAQIEKRLAAASYRKALGE